MGRKEENRREMKINPGRYEERMHSSKDGGFLRARKLRGGKKIKC